jgi:predicted nucleotidyltransferase
MGPEGTRSIETSLRTFLARLQDRFRPSLVVLFGSRARQDHLVDSDVDLLIVSEAFEGMGWRDRILRVIELWDGRVSLEPLCYTPEEFERRSREICIVREALREGIPLVNPEKRWNHILRREAFASASDR